LRQSLIRLGLPAAARAETARAVNQEQAYPPTNPKAGITTIGENHRDLEVTATASIRIYVE